MERIDEVYKKHISNLPVLKTPVTHDFVQDTINTLSKKYIIDFILEHGASCFNSIYAEKLAHLILIEKLMIVCPRSWTDKSSVKKSIEVNCIDLLRKGASWDDNALYQISVNKKNLLQFVVELHQQVCMYKQEDSFSEIHITHLSEVLSFFHNWIIDCGLLLGVRTKYKAMRRNYLSQCFNALITGLATPLTHKNNVIIDLYDIQHYYLTHLFMDFKFVKNYNMYDSYKEILPMFLTTYRGRSVMDNVKANLPYICLHSRTTYLNQSIFVDLFNEYSKVKGISLISGDREEEIASEVILDFSKICDYNLDNNDIEQSLRDLYIDAQGINQIKRYTLIESTGSKYNDLCLLVRIINVDMKNKELVERVIETETQRLINAYADKFRYEIEVKNYE